MKFTSRLRIGELLLDAGLIDAATLQAALEASRASGRRLGETLVQWGAVSDSVLKRFLRRQRMLRALALLGCALSSFPVPATGREAAIIDVRAVVLERASIKKETTPRTLDITDEDVSRGYVELDRPVEVEVQSNHSAGVALGFTLNAAQLAGIEVRSARGGKARRDGVFVPHPGRGLRTRKVWLELRLRLSPAAQPGRIPVPITLVLTPL